MTVVRRLKLNSTLLLCSQANRRLFSLPSYPRSIQKLSPNDNFFAKEQTLMSLFKHCSTMKHLKQIHAQIILTGFNQNLFVVGKIIVFCTVSEHGDMDYAISVFDRIENPDGFLFNTMIRGFGKATKPENAFEFYKKMQDNGLIADNFTFSFLLKVSGQLGYVKLGKQLHGNVLKHGLESHRFVRNTLIHVYGIFKDIDTARRLFEEMTSSDLVAWNTIITCHCYCGMYKEAIDLFLQMYQSGTAPDEATLVEIFSACSSLGVLDFGMWLHSCIKHSNLINIVSVLNVLIDMYAKCGEVEEAYEIFDKMGNKNIVTWNTMIMGLANHGHFNEALELFSKMSNEKLEKPDNITFLGVLYACSHGGMVDEGRRYFDIMRKDYSIQPTLKHYGCMVDVLGRAGNLEEAYNLIRSMPMDCNAIIWRTLLAACRVHGNVKLGETVRCHLLELEPEHSGDYVLLANTYASSDLWNEMIEVRKLMHDRRVQKPEPGNSYIT